MYCCVIQRLVTSDGSDGTQNDPGHPENEWWESGRNAYTRGKEHLANIQAQDENKSVLKLHSLHHHNGRDDVNLTMKVTGTHTSSLDRQVTERVNIENFHGQILMNRRNELGGVRIDRMQYRRWGGQWERYYGGHQTLLKERGSSSSIRGGGTLGGEEEGGAVCFIFTFTFDQGKWKCGFYHNNCLSCWDFIVSAWNGLVPKVLAK